MVEATLACFRLPRRVRRVVSACMAFLTLSACGLRVPSMQPYTSEADATIEGFKEIYMIAYVKCELHRSVLQMISDQLNAPMLISVDWIKKWGAQMSMKVTVDEKSTLAPGLSFNSPYENAISYFRTGGNVISSQSFSLGVGLTASSEATRVETIGMYFPFADFFKDQEISIEGIKATLDKLNCNAPVGPGGKKVLDGATIESDLQIENFFHSKWVIAATPDLLALKSDKPVDGSTSPFETLNYEVKFIVTTSASLNPVWKLIHIATNATGNLLSAMRMRTDDITLVMGEAVQQGNVFRPSPAATAQFQAVINAQAIGAQMAQ